MTEGRTVIPLELRELKREIQALRYSQAGKYERAIIRRRRQREDRRGN